MSSFAIVYLLCVHYIADFILQPHSIATRKSKDTFLLSLHIATYATALSIAFLPFAPDLRSLAAFVGINAGAHFVTDFVTSRWSSSLWRQERVRPFFLVIGLDQLAHTVVLVLSLESLLR